MSSERLIPNIISAQPFNCSNRQCEVSSATYKLFYYYLATNAAISVKGNAVLISAKIEQPM